MKNIFLLVLLLSSLSSFGQIDSTPQCNLIIKGIVVDAKTHQVLPYAAVKINDSNRGTITDEEGNFQLGKLCSGSYSISITMIGYNTVTEHINLVKDYKREFVLDKVNVQLKEVVVEAHPEEESIQKQNSIKGLALQNTRGASLAAAIQSLPGVNMVQTGPSIAKPVIHGLHSNRILILNNGIRLEGQQWGSEHAPEIDPFVASQVSVVSGAASIRYGSDAIGGVIMVQPKNLPVDSTIGGELNIVGISNGRQGVASGILEGNVPQLPSLSFRVQGTYKKGGKCPYT